MKKITLVAIIAMLGSCRELPYFRDSSGKMVQKTKWYDTAGVVRYDYTKDVVYYASSPYGLVPRAKDKYMDGYKAKSHDVWKVKE